MIIFLHAGAEWYGADKILYQTVIALKEEFRCHIILPCHGLLEEKLKQLGVEVDVIAYPILRRKYLSINGAISYLRSFFSSFGGLYRIAKNSSVFAIHTNTLAVTQGYLLKILTGKYHLVHIHEIIVSPRLLYCFLRALVFLFSDKGVAVSEAVRLHMNLRKVVRIYNGIPSIGIPRAAFHAREVTVGMVGRFNGWKGQMDFLRAMEKLDKSLFLENDISMILCGGVFENDTQFYEKFMLALSTSPIKECVTVLPFTENIYSVYNKLDILVLPSTLPDPFPTVVLEAMSMGLAITGYAHGGILEMVKTSEILAAPNDVDSLSRKIARLINDKTLLREEKSNSLIRFCDFSVEAFSVEIRKCYNNGLVRN